MGRIKSLMVKRAAKQLLSAPHEFGEEFNHNKKILGRTMPSKPIRNKIAGYIARLQKAKRNESAREAVRLAKEKARAEKSELLQAEQ